jgi:Gpi18-like mannosyltransferase
MFLIISIYYIEKEKYLSASALFALSFLSKLIAIFLLPLIIQKAGIKKSMVYFKLAVIVALFIYHLKDDASTDKFLALSQGGV